MVYIILADGFEEIEALTPVDVLRRGGVSVAAVSVSGKTVTGSHNITVEADMLIGDIPPELPEMIVLPGGMPGTRNLDASEPLHELLRKAFDANIYIAAICAAPMILGYAGYLNAKSATCYPGYDKYLIGAQKKTSQVVCDGNIITAASAGASLEFAVKLLELLKGKETAEKTLRQFNPYG